MKRKNLLILAIAASMLMACNPEGESASSATPSKTEPATSQSTPTPTSEETPVPTSEETPLPSSEDIPASSEDIPASSEDVPASSEDIPASSEDVPASSSEDVPSVTVTSLSLNTENVKKVYLLSLMTPDRLDVVDPEGLVVTANLSDGTSEAVALNQVTIDKPALSSKGEKTVTVSYGEASATYTVKVGEYKATAADIANVEGRAIVTISGVYDGVTAEELKAFPWSGDFQMNGYNGGAWNGGWDECANGAITLNAADGAFNYTRDVTDLTDYLYTGHFGHKKVPNNNNGVQNMDLKIMAEEEVSKSITIGEKSYQIDYNLDFQGDYPEKCWGDLSLTVRTAGAPRYEIAGMTIEDREGVPYFVATVNFENYTEDEFRALAWATDFQHNNSFDGQGWDRVHRVHDMSALWTISEGVAKYAVDISDLAVSGYTVHFGVGLNESGDNAGEALDTGGLNVEAMEITIGTRKYNLGKNASFWGNVALVITDLSAPRWNVSELKVVEDESKPTLLIKVAFENYTEDAFRALEWKFDFEGNGNYPNGWSGRTKVDGELGAHWVIAENVATYKVDLSDLAVGGYTMHFGVGNNNGNAVDYKPAEFTNSTVAVSPNNYSLVCWPNIGDDGAKFWGCVGLIIERYLRPFHSYAIVGSFNGWSTETSTAFTYNEETLTHSVTIELEAGTEFKVLQGNTWGNANEFWWHFADKLNDATVLVKGDTEDHYNAIVQKTGTFTLSIHDDLASSAWYDGILDKIGINFEAAAVVPEEAALTFVSSGMRIEGAGAFINIDNSEIGLAAENQGDAQIEVTFVGTGVGEPASHYSTGGDAAVVVSNKIVQDISAAKFTLYVTMDKGIDPSWDYTHEFTIAITFGGKIYRGVATFVRGVFQAPAEPEKFTLYFKDAGWWNKDAAATMISVDGGAKAKMTHIAYVGAQSANYWKFDVVETATKVQFFRYNEAGNTDWGAATVEITLADRGEHNMYSITATEVAWVGEGHYVTGAWADYDYVPGNAALPVIAHGNADTKIDGAGIWVYLDNSSLGITGANAADAEVAITLTAASENPSAAPYVTGGSNQLTVASHEFNDYGEGTVRLYVVMNAGVPNNWDMTITLNITMTFGGTVYQGTVVFFNGVYQAA